MIDPKVSIIVSTYNGEKFLSEQLESLVKQDYSNFEIIVFDDVSSDATWRILQEWKDRYPDLLRIHRNEQNVGWSLNFGNGVSAAAGKYIAWCDQDDIWLTDKISNLVEVFRQNSDATLVYHDGLEFKNDGEIIEAPIETFRWGAFYGSDPVTLFWQCRILGHRMMFLADLKEDVLPAVDKSYDWWIQVLATTKGKTYHCPKKLVKQRIHESSAVFSHPEDHIKTEIRRIYCHNFLKFRKYYNPKDLQILEDMTMIMDKHVHGKFDWDLFWFSVKNRYKLCKFLEGGNGISREIFRWRLARSWAKNW